MRDELLRVVSTITNIAHALDHPYYQSMMDNFDVEGEKQMAKELRCVATDVC